MIGEGDAYRIFIRFSSPIDSLSRRSGPQMKMF
jgi:hypothetical protein